MTSFAQDMGVDYRRADVFGEDNQRLSFTVCNVKFLLNGEMIGNCFFFKKDDNTKMKKNASLFRFSLGKERERIFQVIRELVF